MNEVDYDDMTLNRLKQFIKDNATNEVVNIKGIILNDSYQLSFWNVFSFSVCIEVKDTNGKEDLIANDYIVGKHILTDKICVRHVDHIRPISDMIMELVFETK